MRKASSKVEECWILTGQHQSGIWLVRRRQYAIGEPASVAFDAAWALAREENRGDVLGFLHTHPMGNPSPSLRDLRTMRAWCSAFGKPLLCVIAAPKRTAGFVFDANGEREVARVARFERHVMVIVENRIRRA